MAKAFIMAVKGIAKSWYASLEPGSVYSWEQLRKNLVANFQGNRPKEETKQMGVTARLYEKIHSFICSAKSRMQTKQQWSPQQLMDYHIAPSHASLLEQQSQQQNNSLTSGRNIYIRSDEDYSRRKDSAKQATRSPDRRRSNQEREKSSSHRDNKSNDNSRKNVNEVARDESRNNSESQSRDRRNDDSRKRKGNGSSMAKMPGPQRSSVKQS